MDFYFYGKMGIFNKRAGKMLENEQINVGE